MDKYCQKVLQKNFPNIPIEEDIKNVKGKEYEADVITGGFPANHSASQENKKEQTITAISGQKCLDSLGRSNPNSLLGRMCKDLLTSKTAWYSDRCKTNWKVKVSKSNVSLFQLQASVLGTKGTESGLWATPNTMDYLPPRSAAGTKKIMEGHRKGRTKPSNLREQVDPGTMKIYQDMGQVEKHLRSKKQSFPTPTTFDSNEINKPRKPHPGGGQKPPLNQVVKMYPNTNTRLSIGENEEVQARRDTSTTSSENVSNTDSIRHRRWSSEGCTNKGWSFLQREQEGREMGSETQEMRWKCIQHQQQGSQRTWVINQHGNRAETSQFREQC